MKSISIKLWGLMLALVFIALALIWFFQIVFLDQFYFGIHEKRLLKESSKLADMIQQNQASQDIEAKLDELLLKYNARIDYFTASGVMIFSSENAPKMLEVDKGSILNEIVKGNKVVRTVRQSMAHGNVMIVGFPVIKNNVVTAAIIMSVPMASVNETVETLKEQFIIICMILILVSAMLSYVFSRYFTRPILEINKAAMSMADGNLSIKVPINTKDELGNLAATINHLSSQLQKNEQLRKELIANVSHEFRTPLSLIKGYAETLRDVDVIEDKKRRKQLDIIIEESDKLNIMVNEILDLSQIQSEYFNLEHRDFRIDKTIEAVINRLAYHAECKSITIESDCQVEAYVNADECRIEQVIYNLVSNAINHSHENSKIIIKVIEEENEAVIEVHDQGEGIPQQDIPYIWDRFYKVKSNAGRISRGSGLGLAIVKSIMEAHNCSYGVESDVGKGSRFWFRLKKNA